MAADIKTRLDLMARDTRTSLRGVSSLCRAALAELEEIEKVAIMGRAVVEDFFPNLGNCVLKDYARLNAYMIQSSRFKGADAKHTPASFTFNDVTKLTGPQRQALEEAYREPAFTRSGRNTYKSLERRGLVQLDPRQGRYVLSQAARTLFPARKDATQQDQSMRGVIDEE